MASVRARRPPSPPPSYVDGPPHQHQHYPPPPPPQPRFPPKEGHLDADARREAARSGRTAASARSSRHASGGLNLAPGEWRLLAVVLVVAAAVRLFRISQPDSVVFDEVHFGKFAARYIKTRYFVDVHPPLAKLLITLAAFLFGFNGHFEFDDIAKPFENTPYVAMRMVPALLGLWTVPLAYMTLRMLDCRATSALLGAVLIIFENAMVTQSRHILLDAPLVFFTALTVFFWVGFSNEDARRDGAFSDRWWTWLVLSGLALGAVVSCKWVGLFTIATVGLGTLRQLWLRLGDTRVSARLWVKHFLARALCLVAVPVLFYMFMFQIHFAILQNSGEGDGFMSPEFQHTLGGHRMDDTFADVVVGSTVSIRHVNTQGGYLHSHAHNYPTGSKQQQVTLYPHLDSNNDWRIANASASGDPYSDWASLPAVEYIANGARIKLRHLATEKSLHSHDYRPPVSEVDFQNEASAYGMPGFAGDANDDWIVEIDHGERSDPPSRKRLRALRTTFRLKHALTGCYLFSHKVKLPAWGFDQQEVTCNKNAVRANSLWMIETNTQPNLPKNAPKVNYRRPGFIKKFLELNTVMWTTNAGLTERHTFDSRPSSWPTLRRGINFWAKDHRQIYLTGNPFVWWLSTAAIFSYVAVRGLLILRAKRGFRDFENTKVVKYDTLCGFLFLGWALHYLPFYLMARQLFLHHYLPALYFAVLLLCAVFDLLTATLRPVARLSIAALIAILVVWNFAIFSPLAYGLPWTRDRCHAAQWRKTWDFGCVDFHDTYAKYAVDARATPHAAAVPVVTIGGGPDDARGPIVVEDLLAVDELAGAPPGETHVDRRKAEPGRDIFAAADKDKVEAVTSVAATVLAEDAGGIEKEVTVVAGGDPVAVMEKQKVVEQVAAVDAKEKVEVKGKESVDEKPDNEALDPIVPPPSSTQVEDAPATATVTATTTTAAGSERLYAEPAGPMDEAEAEAEEVREELFPGEGKV